MRTYLWDELAAAAWIDPTLITAERVLFMDVNVDRGAGFSDTLTWSDRIKPGLDLPIVHAQMDVDMAMFGRMFVEMMTRATPGAKQ